MIVFAALTLVLSYWPVRNMISRRQRMNMSFNPFHLINTYGAFGSIGRTRREVVIEGTDEPTITEQTVWKEYEFKGKPGSVRATAAAMGAVSPATGLADVVRRDLPAVRVTRGCVHSWCGSCKMIRRRCACCATIHSLMPRRVTCVRRCTGTASPPRSELRRDHAWWHRTLEGDYLPPIALRGTAGR